MKAVLFLVALSGLCWSSVYGIECYSCIMGCSDPFDSKNVETTECDACMKMKGEKDDQQIVQRGCAIPGMPSGEECHEEERDGVEAHICICSSNLCNSGNHIKLPVTMAALFVVIVHFWKYVF